MSVASKELMERTGVITSIIGIVLGMAITSWIGAYQARKSALPRPAPAPWDYQ